MKLCNDCGKPIDHDGRGELCRACQRLADQVEGDARAGLACDNCGRVGGVLERWDPRPSPLAAALEAIGCVGIKLICDHCRTCAVCGEAVVAGQGAPRVAGFPALHTRCLPRPEAGPRLSRLRRVLAGGNGAPETLEELEHWLDDNAGDIWIAVLMPDGRPARALLADLDAGAPEAAAEFRELCRQRWQRNRWLPTLASVVERALRRGQPITLVTPVDQKGRPS